MPLERISWPIQDAAIRTALEQAWADGSWGRYEGPHGQRLQAILREMHSIAFAFPCSSGTIAVELALRGLGVRAHDEVILAGYDFGGNFRAIEAIGAKPVLVDIDPGTWCLDANLVERARSAHTRAILVSHLHGGLADMDRLRKIADAWNIGLVEDACQSPGAIVQGRIAGTWGHAGVLSFGGSKLVTAGRGGAVLTGREDVYQRIKVFCERGNHAFPLSELQAAVLPPQLESLPKLNSIRSANTQRLVQQLADVRFLTPVRGNPDSSIASYYKLGFLYRRELAGDKSREEFLAAVQAANIPLDIGFRGFTGRGASRCRQGSTLEHAAFAAQATVVLHHPILLESPQTIDQLAKLIQEAA